MVPGISFLPQLLNLISKTDPIQQPLLLGPLDHRIKDFFARVTIEIGLRYLCFGDTTEEQEFKPETHIAKA
jgi:hypothetical protein